MKQHHLFVVLLIYGFLSLATLLSSHVRAVTGDEPHYLVMASGIAKHGSLEQTLPYLEEFKTRKIYKNGLAPREAQPSPQYTHAVSGPHGLFNVHNIGLPILLALPFLIGGVVGAKLFMMFLGSLVITFAWKFSSYFSDNKTHRFWTVIAATISLPLLPASNQIYPDLLAGLIALTGLFWFFTTQQRRTASLELFMAATIVFLPWLQIKFAATCVILVLSITAKIFIESKDIKRILPILIIAAMSAVLLVAYNDYAFGKISGPYQAGALEISKTSLMVLFGLHFDQNQGFLLQNPVNFIGVFAIGWMYKRNLTFAVVWTLVYFSLIVPNALHPAWYGGFSFSGRFQWAAAMVFIIPTICGLLVIANNKQKLFKAIIIIGVLLQFYFFYQYTIGFADLYNKSPTTWFDAYSIFYYPLYGWLPMLYDSSWAYGYWPNYAWMLLISALLLMGFLRNKNAPQKAGGVVKARVIFSAILIFVFVAGFMSHRKNDQVVFYAAQLPSQTGRLVNSHLLAKTDTDQPGFLNFGPYLSLRNGCFNVVFSYKSSADPSTSIGWVDVYDSKVNKQIIQVPIHGTSNRIVNLSVDFQLTQYGIRKFEFRTYWNGASDLEMTNISLRKK